MIEDWLPENYFCTFYELLDENIVWQVYIYRYYSILNSETIHLQLEPSSPKSKDKNYNDDFLRDNSYITSDGNITSSAYIDIAKGTKSLTTYVRNNFIVNKSTFKVVLQE